MLDSSTSKPSIVNQLLKVGEHSQTLIASLYPTLLCQAASEGDVNTLEQLAANGASVSIGDYDGRTPLHVAAHSGQACAVDWLLKHGADVHACDRWGQTPLFSAIHGGHRHVVRQLRAAHAAKKPHKVVALASAESAIDPWEISASRLAIDHGCKLGSGAFSHVYKGKLKGIAPALMTSRGLVRQNSANYVDADVAIKMLPHFADSDATIDFLQEIEFMKSLGHHQHLVSLLACITRAQPVCLITEYCQNGDLCKLLRREKTAITSMDEKCAFTFTDLDSFAWQVADGLSYLASKHIIHRDVAARNVLVTQYKTAKLSDFGLCRLLEQSLYTARGGRLPIKWMAIESLLHYEYTDRSDVWSFGILLWEIWSFAETPYHWLQPADMVQYLKEGKRLSKPEYATDSIYKLMQECWAEELMHRPHIDQVKYRLRMMLEKDCDDSDYVKSVIDDTYLIPKSLMHEPI